MKAWSHSSFQLALLAPLRVIKNGFNKSVKQDMNRPRAASWPVNYCTPFLEVGTWESIIALNWIGLASISLWVTIKPKNLPELTPNAHFKGLSFMLYFCNSSKASYR